MHILAQAPQILRFNTSATFSKANKTRDPQIFRHLYHKLLHYIESAHPEKRLVLCPFDAIAKQAKVGI